MKTQSIHRLLLNSLLTGFICIFLLFACNESDSPPIVHVEDDPVIEEETEQDNFKLPQIDLSHWKVTLPIGSPTEVHPPEILDYATNETLKPFMYNDSIEGSLVFYTYPGASTANSSYSRTELRELIDPSSSKVNWSFEDGGRMKGRLAMSEISKDDEGNYHRAIIMQIHGRLSDDQRDLISAKDNNAPPVLKIYWVDGNVRVKSKVLKDQTMSDVEILSADAWEDDEGFNFEKYVGFEPFSLEIIASEGRMEIVLNDTETYLIENDDLKRWKVFENYFKAGNYLVTTDQGSFSKVKFYELEVRH